MALMNEARVPVDGRDQHHPARPDQARATVHEQRQIGDMLHHLHVEHGIVALAAGRQCLGRAAFVLHAESLPFGMGTRNPDSPFHHVHAMHARAQPCDGLAEYPATTADIENPEPLERLRCIRLQAQPLDKLIADIASTQRVHAMQRPEGA